MLERDDLYERGLSLFNEKDARGKEEAVELFKKASIQGHAAALAMLGLAYDKGVGVERDPTKGQKHFFARLRLKGKQELNTTLASV